MFSSFPQVFQLEGIIRDSPDRPSAPFQSGSTAGDARRGDSMLLHNDRMLVLPACQSVCEAAFWDSVNGAFGQIVWRGCRDRWWAKFHPVKLPRANLENPSAVCRAVEIEFQTEGPRSSIPVVIPLLSSIPEGRHSLR